jgi:hypothetical protein
MTLKYDRLQAQGAENINQKVVEEMKSWISQQGCAKMCLPLIEAMSRADTGGKE